MFGRPWFRLPVLRGRSVRAATLAGTTALVVLLTQGGAAAAGAATATAWPSLRVITPAASVEVDRIPGQPIFADPGVLLESQGGFWQVDIRRPGYGPTVVATQVARGRGTGPSAAVRELPPQLVSSLAGLDRFFYVSIRDSAGRRITHQRLRFCPAGADERTNGSGPLNPTYPRTCVLNPFSIGSVIGIDRGWATSALGYAGIEFSGRNGTYHLRLTITSAYRRFFGIRAADASARVDLVVKNIGACGAICPPNASQGPDVSANADALTPAPTVEVPPASTLPDLVALPAWNITTDRIQKHDVLDFAATVWDRGPAPLLVEGFRAQGQAKMNAWQYFTDARGHISGRLRVGELHYDARPGHEHWHFEQFARYSLLDAQRRRVVLSEKEAFCLAPTDAIDMTVPRAAWTPSSTGLATACGDALSIWVREVLPAGWGDTYLQTLPGQSFDITDLPNGTYYISVEANPSGVLYERTRANDVQLRKVILGGRPGHRTVQAAPWHGITS